MQAAIKIQRWWRRRSSVLNRASHILHLKLLQGDLYEEAMAHIRSDGVEHPELADMLNTLWEQSVQKAKPN
jgi:hypothetical protein